MERGDVETSPRTGLRLVSLVTTKAASLCVTSEQGGNAPQDCLPIGFPLAGD